MPRESRNIRGNLKEDFSWWFYSLLFANLVVEASKGPFLLIRTQCSRVIYNPTVPRIFPQATTASWGSVAPVNHKCCPLSHGPESAALSTSSKAKGNCSRKSRKYSHTWRGNFFSLNSTGFQGNTLHNSQDVKSRAYTNPSPQINCPQPQSPLPSVGLVHEEENMIVWLNKQFESQQSLIQPLIYHRLPTVTLEIFLHLWFSAVPKDLNDTVPVSLPSSSRICAFVVTVRSSKG